MSKSFIVIEGPDGTGKSTLAEAFEKGGWSTQHTGEPEYHAFDYYMDFIRNSPEEGLVLDRFHPSNFIYGNIFRGLDDLTPYEHWILDGTLLGYNSFIIYARTSEEENDKIISKGPDDTQAELYEDPSRQQEVRNLYDFYMANRTPLPVLPYNYEDPEALSKIVSDAESLEEFFAGSPSPVEGSNPFGNKYSPRLCFVGSKPTYYLFRALTAAKTPLNQVCIIEDVPEDLGQSEYWLNVDFVSFSKEIKEKLDRIGIISRLATHPDIQEKNDYRNLMRYSKLLTDSQGYQTLSDKGFIIPNAK